MTNQKISIDTMIDAPVERVWEAYTTPDDITRWNFASGDCCCPSAESDLKVGGAYKARMEGQGRQLGFDFEAVYDEIEPYKAITLAMSDGRKAHTTFPDHPAKKFAIWRTICYNLPHGKLFGNTRHRISRAI